jgi:hypothetical protein
LLVPLSVPEIRRLLCLLVWPAPTDPWRVLGWSWGRRRIRHGLVAAIGSAAKDGRKCGTS